MDLAILWVADHALHVRRQLRASDESVGWLAIPFDSQRRTPVLRPPVGDGFRAVS
jgi:hypothetical protein